MKQLTDCLNYEFIISKKRDDLNEQILAKHIFSFI